MNTSSFSHTSIGFTKEDEKRELGQLTEAEKKEILDDKYGRNNIKKKEEVDENNDINDKMLEDFHEAIEELPSDKSGMFWRACLEADSVGNTECDPARFLRCENYDPKRAAIRMCEYWNTRHEIFGEEDAFKPLTLDGAMKDAIPYMMQIPNFSYILPDDEHGRTVICIDRTGVSFKDYKAADLMKITWFAVHKALEKQSTQKNGIVMIIINQTSSWDQPPIKFIKLMARSVFHGLPIKICWRHACFASIVLTLIVPIFKYLASRYHRLRVQIHSSLNQPKMLNELESFGLHRKNLPKSIGGKYDKQPPWVNECKHFRKEQIRRKKRQKI